MPSTSRQDTLQGSSGLLQSWDYGIEPEDFNVSARVMMIVPLCSQLCRHTGHRRG